MIPSFYDITWCCDSYCDMSVSHDNCHILSQNLIPSIFRIREKEKRKKKDRKSLNDK